MDGLHVATLNIRNLADRWDERLPLLLADFAALQPDLLGLQEVVYVLQQDRIIGSAGAGEYRAIRGWAGRPEYGNATLVRAGLEPTEIERLDLGLDRSALRTRLALAGGLKILFGVTHLHHRVDGAAERDAQAAALVAWLDGAPPTDAQVMVGDFNADPAEPAYARMIAAGFRSAFLEANGSEPAVTWPSGLKAPGMDDDGEPDCLDYIWLRGAAAVDACRLAFDRPSVDDPTLYPSDHLGLAARLRIG
ncbi:MAG: endonuclease/exonuclease/phosphatase family protein [Chloroflexota bacterium]|nr:endonuclease/exonuclease/phosphatase family protein [Chloroflexota bacterium]